MKRYGFKSLCRYLSCFAVVAILFASQAAAQWDAPPGYYSAATGNGQTLKNQLTSIMSTGHVQRNYGDFRFSAAIHDQDPNNPGNVLLVYNRASVNSTWDNGSTWNREHVWPQSRQPGNASNSSIGNLGDPHALRPINPAINSSRGNKPFGFENTTGVFGSLGEYFFPGDSDKGDIARSLFYSDTRWTSLGLSLTDNFPTGNQMGDLSSQIAWHYLDPPDEFERRRNHTIYSDDYNPQYFTNNRNAFVDRPEYVWSIYVDQQNDSMITINGGSLNGDGESSLAMDFGTIIVGATVDTNQTVTLDKNGMDGTYYSIQVFEDAVSSATGFYNSFRTNGTDSRSLDVGLEFNPSEPGLINGLIVVDNLDVTTQGGAGRGSNDGNDFIDLSLIVLDHSNASFSGSNDLDKLEVDLGEFLLGDSIPASTFQVYNLVSTSGVGLTARLDLIAIDSDPVDTSLVIDGPIFENLSPGESKTFSVSGVADELGSFQTDFTFLLNDEEVPGATTQTIELRVSYMVVNSILLGDVNDDGFVNLLDVSPFVDLLSGGGFNMNADINQDGFVNLLDVGPFIELLSGG